MNPLRVFNRTDPDTLQGVHDVLVFLADAFYAISSADFVTGSENATRGAGHILNVCADALRESEEDEANPDGG